jgi:cytochrome b involved in lipid metabolism
MVVLDKVYDLTDFIEYHPGGYEIMLEYGGTDATNAFIEKPHTIEATDMLEKYLIGELVKVIICLYIIIIIISCSLFTIYLSLIDN